MSDRDLIPMPTLEERQAAIKQIVDTSLSKQQPIWLGLPWWALFFGVKDCLLLSLLTAWLPTLICLSDTDILPGQLVAVLFFSAPLLYATAMGLVFWKENLSGCLEWQCTCRTTPQKLLALRILALSTASVLVCVPLNLLLWQNGEATFSFLHLLGLSYASLFGYIALCLLCQRWRWGVLLPTALWLSISLRLLLYPKETLLLSLPTGVFFLLAGLGMIFSLLKIYRMLKQPNRGGFIYAYR